MNLNEFIVKYPNVDINDLMSTAFTVVNAIEEARQEVAKINGRDEDALDELRRKMDSSPDDYMYEDYDNALEELRCETKSNHTIEELDRKLNGRVIRITIERT
jgi:hypothetical protein